MSQDTTRTDALRAGFLDHMRPATRAWSVNGRDVEFTAAFDSGLEVGGFMAVTTPSGTRLLVQVHSLRTGSRDALRVDIDAAQFGTTDTAVRGANVAVTVRYVEGQGATLGELGANGLRSARGQGFSEGTIALATDDEVDELVAGTLGSSVGLSVGRLSRADVDARLRASGFARHTFLCGQSGSGKTYTLGVLLERLLADTSLPFVVIDPNSDYVGLGRMRSRTEINRSRATKLSAPEYADLAARFHGERVVVASARSGDLPLRIHLSDLTLDEQALTLGLDPIADADEFATFAAAVRSIGSACYDFAMVREVLHHRFDEGSRRLAQRLENLGVAAWSVWAAADEPSLIGHAGGGRRALVLDTGSLIDARERSVVALALFGILRRRLHRQPVSIVIDEAHNVCSPDATTPLERAVVDQTVWIAGEGRKFGLYLLLSTQRPQKVHRNVISQCDNLLLMRVNSTTDLDELSEIFSHVPSSMVAEAKSFQLGEMLAAGPIAPTPIRLRTAERWSPEGGADLPTAWARGRS